VRITTLNGHYEYVVDKLNVIDPKDVEVLDDAGRPVLTLVTCYPLWHVGPSPKRYVVRAALDGF
jgi:sortase A